MWTNIFFVYLTVTNAPEYFKQCVEETYTIYSGINTVFEQKQHTKSASQVLLGKSFPGQQALSCRAN